MPKIILNTKDLGIHMVWNKHTTELPFLIYRCLDLAALAVSAQQLLPVIAEELAPVRGNATLNTVILPMMQSPLSLYLHR